MIKDSGLMMSYEFTLKYINNLLNYLVYGISFKASLRSCGATEEILQLECGGKGVRRGNTEEREDMSCVLSYILRPMLIMRS